MGNKDIVNAQTCFNISLELPGISFDKFTARNEMPRRENQECPQFLIPFAKYIILTEARKNFNTVFRDIHYEITLFKDSASKELKITNRNTKEEPSNHQISQPPNSLFL